MKKFLAVLIMLFSSIGLLISCGSKNPNCSLEVTSTETTISYSLSFEDLSDKQTSYKVELFKGETSIKQELLSVDVSAGSFRDLEINTDYKVSVFVSDKDEYDLLLVSKEIKTQLGTLTGISFSDQTFTYDGTPKSIEITNLPAYATVSYVGNGVSEVGVHTVTAIVKKENYNDLTLNAKITITTGNVTFDLQDKIVTYNGTAQTITAVGDGIELTYEYYLGDTKLESAPVNVGEYTVKAIYAGDKNHESVEKTAVLTIQKATFDMSGVSFSNARYTYDGIAKELVIAGSLPEGVSVNYENNTLTNAGSIIAKAKFTIEDEENYNSIEEMEAILTIEKATYDMSNISFSDVSYTYDGLEKRLVIAGNLPEGVSVNYENNTLTNAGSIIAKAKFMIEDTVNYHSIEDMVATLTINKAEVAISVDDILVEMGEEYEVIYTCSVSNLDIEITYFDLESNEIAKPSTSGAYKVVLSFSGNENYLACSKMANVTITNPALGNVIIELDTIHSVYKETYEVSPVVTPAVDVTIKYYDGSTECSKPVNAGSYRIEISFAGSATLNPKVVFVDLIIDKATYDMSNISFSDVSYTYDGTEKGLVIIGSLPEGVSVNYENNTLTNAGSIVATAKFSIEDSNNYNLIEDKTATLTILPADADLSTLTQTTFEIDYVSGITVEAFKEMLDVVNLSVENYNLELSFGDNEIVAIYTQDENHKSAMVTIILKCKKAITGFTVLDDHRQIKGRELDLNNLVVYSTFNDGSYEKMATQPSFTISNPDVDTRNVFTIDVTLTSGSYEGQTKRVSVTPIDKPNVMIYAVYTAGGNAKATYTHDFIILYNGSSEDIELSGWTIQYINSKKNISSIPLNGNIKAYSYYLIQCASQSTSVGASLPFTADITSNLNMAVGDCSIYLATTSTLITDNYESLSYVDLLGIGAGVYKEEAVIAKPSNNTSYIRRKDLMDTNNNTTDFEMVAFNGTTDFDFLNAGHSAYNFVSSYIQKLNLDFENLPDTFVLPVSYDGISIIWTTDISNLSISADGTISVTKTPTAFGTLTATIEGYPLTLIYEVKVSDKIILKTPEILLTHLTITWDAVSNATHYEIYVNGQKYGEETACSYDLRSNPNFESVFSMPKSYLITVKACASDLTTYEHSELSNEQTLNVADTTNLVPNTVYLFKAVVTAKSTGTQANFFVVDPSTKVGLLAFNYSTDAEVKSLVYISGKYELFSKMPEITNITGVTCLEVLNDTSFADYIKTEEPTLDQISHVVSGIDAEVLTKPEVTSNYASISVKYNNVNYTLYANKNYVNEIDSFKSLLPGNRMNFNGAIGRYNDNLQIYLTSYEVTDRTVSVDYMLDATLSEISFKANYTADEFVILPVLGVQFNTVQISYSSTTGGNINADATTATLTFDSSATNVTITVVASVSGLQKSKDVTLVVSPAGSAQETTVTLSSQNSGNSVNMTATPSDSNSEIIGDTEHNFNISSKKNNASNTAGVNKDGTIRLYGKADTMGTSLTISGKEGITIKSVKVTLKASSGTGNFKVNDGVAEQVGTTGQTFTYVISNNEIIIQNVNESTAQIYILSIEITYSKIN